MAYNLTHDEVVEFWERYAAVETAAMLARRFGKGVQSTNQRIQRSGGCRPTLPRPAVRHLSLEDREEISRGLAAGESLRAIARRVGRAASTIAREVAANGGRAGYRPAQADRAATRRRRRPKVCKLAASPRLAALVEDRLKKKWSPEQIVWVAQASPPGRSGAAGVPRDHLPHPVRPVTRCPQA